MTPQEMKQLAELLQTVPGIKSIDLKDVKGLAQLLRESPEIGSIEVTGWFGTGVVITRTQLTPPPPPAPVFAAPPAYSPAAPAAEPEPREPVRPAVAALKEVKSPMVGTFYRSPEPGAEPYVKVGSRITSGQTVCIIEAMKIMNEIEAEITGVVREVSVDDAQPVEFGQVLFRIDPHG
jgi:acetyl-CoA carboxylase biotin carboxyl carrier protein